MEEQTLKKLIALGVIVATAAFGGMALAGEGGTGHDLQIQELMEWSARAADQAKKEEQAKRERQMAGRGAQPTNPVPPYQQYPSGIR